MVSGSPGPLSKRWGSKGTELVTNLCASVRGTEPSGNVEALIKAERERDERERETETVLGSQEPEGPKLWIKTAINQEKNTGTS